MAEETPSDLPAVRYSFRFGWAVAELRGRYHPDHFDRRDPGGEHVFKRGTFQLPLAAERSPAEVRKELIETVEALSKQLELDKVVKVQQSWEALKKQLEESEAAKGRKTIWEAATKGFFQWDAHIQDALVLEAPRTAGYQLGRGLAETYWGLEAEKQPDEMGSWEFVLGKRRSEILQRFAARLSSYLGTSVVAAIEGPLAAWSALAETPDLRGKPEAMMDLYKQGLLWRDLVRGERQTADLSLSVGLEAPPVAVVWRELGLYKQALSSLRVPLIIGLFGAAVLALGGLLLASGTGNNGLSTAISILGALGLTSASLYARAKANITSLVTDLTRKVEAERVRQAADLCPAIQPAGKGR
jgi:hypothetical protein